MDFWERGDLCKAMAEQQGPLDEAVVYEWIMSALSGLQAIHSRDVVPHMLLCAVCFEFVNRCTGTSSLATCCSRTTCARC